MNTLTCQVCGFIWTPKFKEHPMRCGSRPCRSMLWDGHRKGEYRQTHGMTATPTYRSWKSMIDEFTTERDEEYDIEDTVSVNHWIFDGATFDKY